jgi:uncharacterized protein (DUF2141 family)
MKKLYLLATVLFLIFRFNTFCMPNSSDITVNIENIESNNGNIRVHLYDESVKKYFPSNSDKAIKLEITKISDNKAVVTFKDLPYGKYAVTVHHDKNLNVKMDKTFFGFPAEGWGVSNNVKPIMRVPKFSECSFVDFKKSISIKISMNN